MCKNTSILPALSHTFPFCTACQGVQFVHKSKCNAFLNIRVSEGGGVFALYLQGQGFDS